MDAPLDIRDRLGELIKSAKAERPNNKDLTILESEISKNNSSGDFHTRSIPKQITGPLVRFNSENDIYLIDIYGLPRRISDEKTLLYLMDIFGYKSVIIPIISKNEIIGIGPDVVSLREWSPPRTINDELSHLARAHFKYLEKRASNDGDNQFINFKFRLDGSNWLQIHSANLIVSEESGLSVAFISPRNNPVRRGFLDCTLLFEGKTESRTIVAGEETCLTLYLDSGLDKDMIDALTRKNLGYIKIRGEYHDTEIDFMIHST